MITQLITLNVRVPGVSCKDTLETIGGALLIILEHHKKYGLDLTEMSVMEHAKLTMGDCAAELCDGSDESFDIIYGNANTGLQTILAANWSDIESFADQLDGIEDVMVFTYDEMIRLCVNEHGYGKARNSHVLV